MQVQAEPDSESATPEQLTLHVQTDGLFAEAPSAVEVDGQALAEAVDDTDCRPCWRYDAELSRVDVHLDGDGAVRLVP